MPLDKSRRLQAPIKIKLTDSAAEIVRRSHDQCIREIQAVPIVGGKIIRDILLAADVDTPISHGLGRRATLIPSAPRNFSGVVGVLVEVLSSDHDPTLYTVLRAAGFSVDVTIDAWVF